MTPQMVTQRLRLVLSQTTPPGARPNHSEPFPDGGTTLIETAALAMIGLYVGFVWGIAVLFVAY